MLSISSYMNSPMLFLDETINNLDAETVGKVATMLEDFIKQRNIKFYTVTHTINKFKTCKYEMRQ